MSLKNLSEETARALSDVIPCELSEAERRKVCEILDRALIKSVEQATKSHRAATVICCGPEADLAHKISEEISRANNALIANLMALR